MMSTRSLAVAAALAALALPDIACADTAPRCVDVSVPKKAVEAAKGSMDRVDRRAVGVSARHLRHESFDAAWPPLRRQGGPGQGRRQRFRAGVLSRRQSGVHADGGAQGLARSARRRGDGEDQPRGQRALTARARRGDPWAPKRGRLGSGCCLPAALDPEGRLGPWARAARKGQRRKTPRARADSRRIHGRAISRRGASRPGGGADPPPPRLAEPVRLI